ncbi:hypothetical protein NLJ89_g2548 [Agrocybe chaxingu]|uniref:ABM domain-containing protein n=1 Tax=Agrocybe chaxingu TaxID=84603 RepID=A0A9W8K456_9AGAR|nr:hypothetical protein NLJ89_g2548 [Agrocybe chaxingu]
MGQLSKTRARPATISISFSLSCHGSTGAHETLHRSCNEVGREALRLDHATQAEKGGPISGKVHECLDDVGVQYTVLHPTWFIENFGTFSQSVIEKDEITSVHRDGLTPLVGVDDIAKVALNALVAEKSPNTDYFVIGPELWTFDEIVHRRLTDEEHIAFYETSQVPREFAVFLHTSAARTVEGEEEALVGNPKSIVGKVKLRDYFETNKGVWKKAEPLPTMLVVEFISWAATDAFLSDTNTHFRPAVDQISKSDGCLAIYSGQEKEDRNNFWMVVAWQSGTHLQAAMNRPEYAGMMDKLRPFSRSGHLDVHHIDVNKDTNAALGVAFTTIVFLNLKAGVAATDATSKVSTVLGRSLDAGSATGTYPPGFWGRTHESARKFVAAIGWSSVQAHDNTMRDKKEVYRVATEELLGITDMKRVHVVFKTTYHAALPVS